MTTLYKDKVHLLILKEEGAEHYSVWLRIKEFNIHSKRDKIMILNKKEDGLYEICSRIPKLLQNPEEHIEKWLTRYIKGGRIYESVTGQKMQYEMSAKEIAKICTDKIKYEIFPELVP